MKKCLLLTLLSLGGGLVAYGQGSVLFQNTNFGSLNAPTYLNYIGGITLGYGYVAELAWSIDGGVTWSFASAPSQLGVYGFGFAADNDPTFGGFFSAGQVNLPNVTPANAGAVDFQILTWQGNTSSTFANAPARGTSVIFSSTLSLPVATGTSSAGDFTGYGLQPWELESPEPATLAIAGLGTACLLVFRRKK